jgi:hypothetical protein
MVGDASSMRPDVFFDSTGNEEAEGDQGVTVEEFDGLVYEDLNAFLVTALVQTVHDDQIRPVFCN